MMTSLVVTLIGPDRPGLVSAVSDKAAAFGANWADSLMANLAGQFAGILHLQVPADKADALAEALRGLAAPGMQIVVAKGSEIGHREVRRMPLELVGHDRPGIIHTISSQLARQGVSIESLKTAIVSGAMSGEQLFEMHAVIAVPADLPVADVKSGLEAIANDLMVDIDFD